MFNILVTSVVHFANPELLITGIPSIQTGKFLRELLTLFLKFGVLEVAEEFDGGFVEHPRLASGLMTPEPQ